MIHKIMDTVPDDLFPLMVKVIEYLTVCIQHLIIVLLGQPHDHARHRHGRKVCCNLEVMYPCFYGDLIS